MITAKIIEDSINQSGYRLTSFEVKYPRFILPEVLTHKMHSFSTSSTRAIPLVKQIKEIRENPAMPINWGANEPGMQAKQEVYEDAKEQCKSIWLDAASKACDQVEAMAKLGLHKQVGGRILEPFMHVRQIITATDWSNFFKLRISEHAQPEIKKLAELMLSGYKGNSPTMRKTLSSSAFHMPYVTREERESYPIYALLMASSSRCARVSYNNHSGIKADMDSDLALYKRLSDSGHESPMSHQGLPICLGADYTHINNLSELYSANFREWGQLRHNTHWLDSSFKL